VFLATFKYTFSSLPGHHNIGEYNSDFSIKMSARIGSAGAVDLLMCELFRTKVFQSTAFYLYVDVHVHIHRLPGRPRSQQSTTWVMAKSRSSPKLAESRCPQPCADLRAAGRHLQCLNLASRDSCSLD
jgi:hypothetical protein